MLLSNGGRIKRSDLTLTPEEMVSAVWKAGEKYEAEGGDITKIDQKTRFQWIAEAQYNKIVNNPDVGVIVERGIPIRIGKYLAYPAISLSEMEDE